MSEAVGIVVAIGVAIVALMAILTYVQASRFFDVSRTQLTRFADSCDRLQKDFSITLKKLGDAADEFSAVSSDFREKLEVIDRDIVPVAKSLEKTLGDANPVLKSLSDSSDDIRVVLESVRRATVDIANVADGVHGVIMPAINTVRSIVAALSEGIRALRTPRK
jgi:methyl-accepting chemotaxis protein